MKEVKIISIVGARPHFIKMFSFHRAVEKFNKKSSHLIVHQIIHSGQHYDKEMSEIFFKELIIPTPNINLNVGSGHQGYQTAKMLIEIEKTLIQMKPDIVVVYGDTNTTLSGALAASKLHIPVAHIESGLRSFNKHMPEELNRIVVDHLADLLFAPTVTSILNLKNEGLSDRSCLSGDIMYDALLSNQQIAFSKSQILDKLNLKNKKFALATIHRAENTDDVERLKILLDTFNIISEKYFSIILPVHPRTAKVIKNELIDWHPMPSLKIVNPFGYIDMIMMLKSSILVMTDSGGVQKEAFMLNKPCITLRDQTEWIEIIEAGANILTGVSTEKITNAITEWLKRIDNDGINWNKNVVEVFGNGNASETILNKIVNYLHTY